MASGDGLLVRVRAGARALTSAELRAIAQLARAYGNGIIELTRRANLQLRGLTPDRLCELQAQLIALGLVDASPLCEARPGLLVDPIAAIEDTAELTELAQALDEALARSAAALDGLSAKLGLVLDAGGGSLSDVDADIRIVALSTAAHVQIQVGTHSGAALLGQCPRARATDAVQALLRALSDFDLAQRSATATRQATVSSAAGARARPARAPAGSPPAPVAADGGIAASAHTTEQLSARKAPRMRDLVAAQGLDALRACADISTVRAAAPALHTSPPSAALGFRSHGHRAWFGVGVPFGSAAHAAWTAIAELAERFGVAELRLTPRREVLLVGVQAEVADELARTARGLGLITEADDPRRQIVACSGAPACSSAYAETRGLASALGLEMQPLLAAGATLHVSGCDKGCASGARSDVCIVLAQHGARLALNADVAAASCAPVESLAAISAELGARLRRPQAFSELEEPAR